MRYRKGDRGFSLIEMMIAMVISVIALMAIYNIFIVTRKNTKLQEQVTDMQENARLSIEYIVRQMRNIVQIESLDCTPDQSSINFLSMVDMGHASACTQGTLRDPNKSWDPNQWQGDTVSIVSGTGVGQKRQISQNSSNTLTVSTSWATTPDSSSFYTINTVIGFARDDYNDELDYIKGAASYPMALNITSFTLQGYSDANSVTCDPNLVNKLDVAITARTAGTTLRQDKQYNYYTVKSSFRLRQ